MGWLDDWVRERLAGLAGGIGRMQERKIPSDAFSQLRQAGRTHPGYAGFTSAPQARRRPSPKPPQIRRPGGSARDSWDYSRGERIQNPYRQDTSRQDLFDELLGLQDPSRYYMDETELRRQAQASAAAQYNPLIAALKQQITGTTERAGRYGREIGEMYGGLSRSIREDIPDIQKLYKETRGRTGEQFEELEGSIKGQYAQSQKEQEETLKRLNIEAAAPDILPQQQADRDYFTGRAREEAATAKTALGQEERGGIEFSRQGAQIARMGGVERRADLQSELEEIVGALQGQVGAHRAARSQAATAGFGQLQQQMMQMAGQRSQQEFQNRMAMLQYERSLEQDELAQIAQQQEAMPEPFVGQDEQMLEAARGYPGVSDANAARVVKAISNAEQKQGFGFDSSGQVSLGSSGKLQHIIAEGRRMRLGPNQLRALEQIARQYLGIGKFG